jgi:hypothetical protein
MAQYLHSKMAKDAQEIKEINIPHRETIGNKYAILPKNINDKSLSMAPKSPKIFDVLNELYVLIALSKALKENRAV